MRKLDPKFQLANHYLSFIYGIYAELEFRAINLNYNGMADVMEKLALNKPFTSEPSKAPVAPLDKRIANHIAWLVYARGRKRVDSPELIFGDKARNFIALHRTLFAEIALTGSTAKETVDTGARV